MKPRAADFRAAARRSLRGYWGMALLVCLVAGLIGGLGDSPNFSGMFRLSNDASQRLPDFINELVRLRLFRTVAYWGIVTFLIGGAAELGTCAFHTRLSLGERPPFSALFSRFDIFLTALGLRLFMVLFIFLWALLLIIPGIIAAYRYSMAPYLMAEYPGMGIREAVNRSKELMHGNKGRLFCLQLSYIGWWLLCIPTFGILALWITPYVQTAQACFYLELTGRPYGLSGEAA
ncbi:MAG: DUF975 family protein [Bacillota bacterium]